jgi:hypothetical protein
MCLILSCSYDLDKIDAGGSIRCCHVQDLSERAACYEALTPTRGIEEKIAAYRRIDQERGVDKTVVLLREKHFHD